MPLWKDLNKILPAIYLKKYFELGAWNFWTNYVKYFQSYGPLQKMGISNCQQDFSKSIWARGLKLGQLIEDGE